MHIILGENIDRNGETNANNNSSQIIENSGITTSIETIAIIDDKISCIYNFLSYIYIYFNLVFIFCLAMKRKFKKNLSNKKAKRTETANISSALISEMKFALAKIQKKLSKKERK